MFEEDYIMRLIKEFTRMIAKVLFHADTESPINIFLKDERMRETANSILMDIDDGDIKNVLETVHSLSESNTLDDLKLGLAVFSQLSDIDDTALERNGCTSSDVAASFKGFISAFGLEKMADLYMFDIPGISASN